MIKKGGLKQLIGNMVKQKKQTGAQFQKERKKHMKLAYRILKPAIHYDPEYDILLIYFSGGQKCESTVELTDDVRVDINKRGMIIGIEICDFSKHQKENEL